MRTGFGFTKLGYCLTVAVLMFTVVNGFACTEEFTNCMELPEQAEVAFFLSARKPSNTHKVGEGTIQNNSPVIFNRVKKGFYNIQLGEIASRGSNVQVSAYGGDGYCQLASWRRGLVNVKCVGADVQPIDTPFSLLLKKSGRSHYLTLDHNKASDRVYITRQDEINWPGMNRTPRISRLGTGSYMIHHNISQRADVAVQLTAFGVQPAYCNIMQFSIRDIAIQCFSILGQQPIDSGFNLLLEPESADTIVVWQEKPLGDDRSPTGSTAEQLNPANRIVRQSVGSYLVRMGKPAVENGGNIQLTAYNSDAYCSIGEWNDANISVACYRGARPFDSGFSLLFTKPAREKPAVNN